ncbi:MAG TPA: hypothetical protein VN922_13445 [Bacteroidia bacterium]|nr:hypothetical protein [Bacteroidia bacterium]
MLITKQEIFDKVAPHLVRQGRQSILDNGSGICAYRGSNGLMCAVGVLIPDNHYEPFLEGASASRPKVQEALTGVVELSAENKEFIVQLQNIHDGTGSFFKEDDPLDKFYPTSRRWKRDLESLAETHKLNTKCLKGVASEYQGLNHVNNNPTSF